MLDPISDSDASANINVASTANSLALNTSALVADSSLMPGRVLVVDDNESIQVFLRHFFKLEGIPVEIIDSPVRALELFQAGPGQYSMLLTDCEMPGMSGVELAYEVRRLRADLPW